MPILVKLVYPVCLALKFEFRVAISDVFVVMLFVLELILESKFDIVDELTPPILFTVVVKLPVPVPSTSPVKLIV